MATIRHRCEVWVQTAAGLSVCVYTYEQEGVSGGTRPKKEKKMGIDFFFGAEERSIEQNFMLRPRSLQTQFASEGKEIFPDAANALIRHRCEVWVRTAAGYACTRTRKNMVSGVPGQK